MRKNVFVDKSGNEHFQDDNGMVHKGVPPPRSKRVSRDFTTYDTSRGHCGLCGSITCNGSCFK